jgi:hypothetical protein
MGEKSVPLIGLSLRGVDFYEKCPRGRQAKGRFLLDQKALKNKANFAYF